MYTCLKFPPIFAFCFDSFLYTYSLVSLIILNTNKLHIILCYIYHVELDIIMNKIHFIIIIIPPSLSSFSSSSATAGIVIHKHFLCTKLVGIKNMCKVKYTNKWKYIVIDVCVYCHNIIKKYELISAHDCIFYFILNKNNFLVQSNVILPHIIIFKFKHITLFFYYYFILLLFNNIWQSRKIGLI